MGLVPLKEEEGTELSLSLSPPCEHIARQLSASQDEGLHQNSTILVL